MKVSGNHKILQDRAGGRRGLRRAVALVASVGVVTLGLVAPTAAFADDPLPPATFGASGATAGMDFGVYGGPRIVQVAERGDSHVIALDDEGRVWGWGLNSSRQVLGNATGTIREPVVVTAITDLLSGGEHIVQVAASRESSYALTSAGRVISWGSDTSLGLGRNTSSSTPNLVLSASGVPLEGIEHISAGRTHALAIDEDGAVWGWGVNTWGQLGINNTTNQRYATKNPATFEGKKVIDVSAGYYHSVALDEDGRVWAWGANSGYLGVGNNGTNNRTLVPTKVVTSDMSGKITAIAAGINAWSHTFAVDEDGHVWSWGTSNSGLLGRAGTVGLPAPVLDTSDQPLTGIVDVSAGYYNGYALAQDGTAYAWGQNNYGQLGVGTTATVTRATKIKNFDLGGEMSDIESISAGFYHVGIISSVGSDDGVLSIAGHANNTGLVTVTGANDSKNRLEPNLVWKYEQGFDEYLPQSLTPRSGETYRTTGAPIPANLVMRDPGTFNYGMTPFVLEGTTTFAGATPTATLYPIGYTFSGHCSLNSTSKLARVTYGNGTATNTYYCNITRTFAGSALVKPLANDPWRVFPQGMQQEIAQLAVPESAVGGISAPGSALTGVTADTGRITLPSNTDTPANNNSLRYTANSTTFPSNAGVCALSSTTVNNNYDGAVTNVQRFLQILGEGNCTLRIEQAGNSSYHEPLSKTVNFVVAAGRAAQTLDLSGLNGIRFAADEPEFALPPTTDALADQTVSYTVAAGSADICAIVGAAPNQSLKALGAGSCVLGVTAPGIDAAGAHNGFHPYIDTKTVVIAKGIQTLEMEGVFDGLNVATDVSADLPATTAQSVPLSWDAVSAEDDLDDVCSIESGGGAVRVLAGDDAPAEEEDPSVNCRVTASNAGNADFEPFSYEETVTIDWRAAQWVDLSALDGKKFGDAPFALPAVTSPGAQPVSYEASGACSVVGTTVTIVSAGDCVIEASAAGTNTEDDPEAGVWYRPFALIQTAQVAALGQYLSGMPALNALKVGAMSAALPTLTVQENALSWGAAPADKCQVIDAPGGAVGAKSVEILSDGDCTVSATAPEDANHTAFSYSLSFAGAINYEALRARVIADTLVENTVVGGFPLYTAASWNAFVAALADGDQHDGEAGQEASNQAEVDAYLEALVTAKAALIDLTELRTTYLERVTLETDYTPNSWADYAVEVADALVVLNDPDATQEDVHDAAVGLGDASGLLVPRADTTLLEEEIEAELLTTDYTVSSWADYVAERAIAQAVVGNLNASQEEVDDALAALVAQREALVNIVALREAVTAEQGSDGHVESDWAAASWSVFAAAFADAEDVLNDAEATQEDVDDALAALIAAIHDLAYPQQTLTMTSLDGIRYAADQPTFALPVVSDTPAGQPVTYVVAAGSESVCEIVLDAGVQLLKALGAGSCELEASAPGVDVPPAAKGFTPYAETKTVTIGKGIQTIDLSGVWTSLTTSDTESATLPATSDQGLALIWAAAPPAVCSIELNEAETGQLVKASGEVPEDYTESICTVTAVNAGNDDFEAFSYEELVEVSPRLPQELDPIAGLDGLKYGDPPLALPTVTTVGNQPLSYSTTGPACEVTGSVLTVLSGGECELTVEAAGTTTPDGDDNYWRPFSKVITVSVAPISQSLSGLDLNGLVVGSTSADLPAETDQGIAVNDWVSTTTAICQVVGGAVVIVADGDCTIVTSNAGNDSYLPFSLTVTFATAIDYTALNAALAAAIGGSNADAVYTAGSWDAYAAARSYALTQQSPNGSSQSDVDLAAEDLIDIQAALVDITPLRVEYNARDTNEAAYTPASWFAYQTAVTDAFTTLNDAYATAAQVQAAIDALHAAHGELVLRADFTGLQAEADIAETLDGSDYASDSWLAYEDERAAAQAVLDDPNATQAEIDAAREALELTRHALVSLVSLRGTLDSELALDRRESDYSPESWADLQDALIAAAAVLGDAAATQIEVDDATSALQDAIAALVYTQQTVLGLPAAIAERRVGEAPITLPPLSDRGAVVSYTAGPVQVCAIVEGKLVINGTGVCTVNWTAPAIGGFPAGSNSASAPTGPGLQLVLGGVQLAEGAQIEAGRELYAQGEGLEPGTELRVELHSDPIVLGAAIVGSDGTARVTFTIPTTVAPGMHTLYAFGVSGIDQAELDRSAAVEIRNLAWTGASDVTPMVAAAIVLILIGTALVLITIRRRRVEVRAR